MYAGTASADANVFMHFSVKPSPRENIAVESLYKYSIYTEHIRLEIVDRYMRRLYAPVSFLRVINVFKVVVVEVEVEVEIVVGG